MFFRPLSPALQATAFPKKGIENKPAEISAFFGKERQTFHKKPRFSVFK
jgi:hypothetical protein